LEFEVIEKGYSEECDRLFKIDIRRRTSERVSTETKRVMNIRRELKRDLIRHYGINRSARRFYPRQVLNENAYIFLEDVLEAVGKGDSITILRRLDDIYSMMEKGLEYRFSKITLPLIGKSKNVGFMKKVYKSIGNSSDAWHIVDAVEWCGKKRVIFCTLDREHFLNNNVSIKECICDHLSCSSRDCPLEIKHITDVI